MHGAAFLIGMATCQMMLERERERLCLSLALFASGWRPSAGPTGAARRRLPTRVRRRTATLTMSHRLPEHEVLKTQQCNNTHAHFALLQQTDLASFPKSLERHVCVDKKGAACFVMFCVLLLLSSNSSPACVHSSWASCTAATLSAPSPRRRTAVSRLTHTHTDVH